MIVIIVTGFEAATGLDVLQGTRLQTVPRNGILGFEFQAADNVAANHFLATVQLPDGSNPFSSMLVPSGQVAGVAGDLDTRLAFMATFGVTQGGHCTLDLTEVGDTEVFWRVTYKGRG